MLNILNTIEGKYLIGKLGQKPEGKIVFVTKNSFVEHLEGKLYRATFFSKNPIEKLFQPILDKISIANEYKRLENKSEAFLHYAGLYPKHNKYPQIYLTTETFNPASGANSPVDGRAQRTGQDATFASVRNGAGTSASATDTSDIGPSVGASITSNQFSQIFRTFFAFDTSTIPDGANIISATFSQYVVAKATDLTVNIGLYLGTLANNNDVVAGDYAGTNGNTTQQSATATAVGSISTSAFYDQALNATGLSNISKTGITVLGSRTTQDADNSAPTWVSGVSGQIQPNFADNGTNIPKLVVEYAETGGGSFLIL